MSRELNLLNQDDSVKRFLQRVLSEGSISVRDNDVVYVVKVTSAPISADARELIRNAPLDDDPIS